VASFVTHVLLDTYLFATQSLRRFLKISHSLSFVAESWHMGIY